MAREPRWRVGDIVQPLESISGDLSCGRVYAIMQALGTETGLAVVDDAGRPIGLASRRVLMKQFAHPVTFALYENRPISLLMLAAPLIVDVETDIDRVSEMVAMKQTSALDDGFIVTREGLYVGIGTVTDLLQISVNKAGQQLVAVEAARAEAERASRAKSRFLANLSHELRTPLNAILGFSELLSSGTVGMVNDTQAEYLDDIQSAGQRLLDMITDLLDLSRAEAGRMELQESTFDLYDLLDEARRILRLRAANKGLTLNVRARRGVQVHGDDQKLLQVILNLATNAVKFTPSGGRIDLDIVPGADGGVELRVADTGPGIPEGDRERVLEPFGRGQDAMTLKAEGAGIGLALTKILTELHDGCMELESTEGVGTVMRVCLPASRVVAHSACDLPRLGGSAVVCCAAE